MLNQLFRRKSKKEIEEEERKTRYEQFLQSLSPEQRTNYEKFAEPLKEFALHGSWENKLSKELNIEYDPQYGGGCRVGLISPEGNIQVVYPEPQAIDEAPFQYYMSGVVELKKTLKREGIPYTESLGGIEEGSYKQPVPINKQKYVADLRTKTESRLQEILDSIN